MTALELPHAPEANAVGAPVERPVRPLYAERDHMAQGEHYLRHIDAMTREGLHDKSAIAGELAARDIEIERLQARLDALMLEHCPDDMTPEQLSNWAAHQRPCSDADYAAVEAALKA